MDEVTTPEFDDLPEVVEEQPVEEKEDIEEIKSQLQKSQDLVREKDRAFKEERDRRKKEADSRRKLEAQLKDKDEEDVPEEEDKAPEQLTASEIISRTKEELKSEQYKDQVVSLIKQQPNMTRAEAKAVLEIVDKLPKSGNPSLDVEFAFDYRAKLQKNERGFSAPAPVGAGVVYKTQQGSISQGALEVGKQFRLTKEDFEKHSGEINL